MVAQAAGPGTTSRRRRRVRTPDELYDPRAVTLLEAAIFSGALPQFRLDGSTKIDLRGMLPSVAEVYLLAVLNALQRRAGSLKHLGSPVTLLLPAYEPRNVFWPSYAVRGEVGSEEEAADVTADVTAAVNAAAAGAEGAEGRVEAVVGSRDSDSEGEDDAPVMAKEATALGVVGACDVWQAAMCVCVLLLLPMQLGACRQCVTNNRHVAQPGHPLYRGCVQGAGGAATRGAAPLASRP